MKIDVEQKRRFFDRWERLTQQEKCRMVVPRLVPHLLHGACCLLGSDRSG